MFTLFRIKMSQIHNENNNKNKKCSIAILSIVSGYTSYKLRCCVFSLTYTNTHIYIYIYRYIYIYIYIRVVGLYTMCTI